MAWARYGAWRSARRTRSSRRWYSGSRRRATGNARAARQQRDSATVTLSRVHTTPVTIPINTSGNAVAINHWDSLRQSTFFNNYAPMYDQMKIDKIRLKITGSQGGSAQTANISPTVVTAFDRNGIDAGQTVSVETVSTYSSSQIKSWSVGNAFVMYQTIYPSTIMEKGQYVPTDSLTSPEADDSPSNPCTNESFSALPFKPITFLGVSTGFNVTAANAFAFTIEYEYTVTFRGMRKPSVAYADIDFTSFATYGLDGTEFGKVLEVELEDFSFNANTRNIQVPSGGILMTFTSPGNYTIDGSDYIVNGFTLNPTASTTTISLPANSYYTLQTLDRAYPSYIIGLLVQGEFITGVPISAPTSVVTVNIQVVHKEDLPDSWTFN